MGAQNVSAIGNLKYDVRAPKQSRVSELIKEAAAGRPVIVGGRTLELSEDSNLINAQQAVPIEARPLLVLAPRHPDEFELVYSRAMEDPTLYATDLIAGKKAQDGFSVRLRENEQAVVQIIVLNTIGDLASVYGIADVAFVGGSLVKRGGHNPLEPAQFGIPVIMGPSFENFRDVVAKMQAADAICIVEDWEQLQGVVLGMLKDREAAKAMGERGRRVFEEQQGATKRAVEAIVAMVMR
jgi:3-deoxy-D-manno-octulosonic-acid transferase